MSQFTTRLTGRSFPGRYHLMSLTSSDSRHLHPVLLRRFRPLYSLGRSQPHNGFDHVGETRHDPRDYGDSASQVDAILLNPLVACLFDG
jgi:hypothetical protein